VTRNIRDPFTIGGRAEARRRIEAALRDAELAQQLQYPVPQFMFPTITPPDTLGAYLNVVTTSGAFHTTHQAILERIVRPALRFWFVYVTDVGTTGEVRAVLSGATGGTFTTATVSIGSGASGATGIRWRHSYPQWTEERATLSIQARRTGGGGNVYIYPSYNGVEQVGHEGATPTGV
jgi:hypothetical protein